MTLSKMLQCAIKRALGDASIFVSEGAETVFAKPNEPYRDINNVMQRLTEVSITLARCLKKSIEH